MYTAFDKFLRVETWHTTHPLDDERFHHALNEVVRHRDFVPSAMADYFRDYLGDKAARFENEIDRREIQAETIHSFLYDTRNLDT